MDCVLKRTNKRTDGIFGELYDSKGNHLYYTLEHAYFDADKNPIPKLSAGTYTCKKGEHALHDGVKFIAFEVTGVPDFEEKPVHGILFHILNYNEESEGCVGIGKSRGFRHDKSWMLTYSMQAFKDFMERQKEIDEFQLVVEA